jgi:hypothetical protein
VVPVHRDIAGVVANAAASTPAAASPAAPTTVSMVASAHAFHIHSITVTLSYCQPRVEEGPGGADYPAGIPGALPAATYRFIGVGSGVCPFPDAAP